MFFAKLGRWCFRHRGKVALLWLGALIVFGGISSMVGTAYSTEFALPDVESRRGFDILDEHFADSGAGGEGGTIVFRAEQGVTDPEVQRAMTAFFERQARSRDAVVSPYTPEGGQQIALAGAGGRPHRVCPDRAPPRHHAGGGDRHRAELKELMPKIEGVQIEIGGQILAEFEVPSSELLGLAFAMIVLILAFGSVLAMGLPVGIALAGIGVGTILAGLLSHVLSIPDFATTIAVMLGLGVGIDYALFIVTRFRENMHAGASIEEATVVALDTAGRAVAFAGTTVVISLLGMVLMGLAFVTGLAAAAATVVCYRGRFVDPPPRPPRVRGSTHRIDPMEGTHRRSLGRGGSRRRRPHDPAAGSRRDLARRRRASGKLRFRTSSARRSLAESRDRCARRSPTDGAASSSTARGSRRRRATILIVLAVPFFSQRLAFSDEGNYPEETTTRKAYDLLAAGFGPGFNGPLLLSTEIPEGTDPATLETVTQALAGDPGTAFVTPAVPNDPETPTAALWRLFPTTAPQDESTTDLVYRLRDEVLPNSTQGTGLDIAVSGGVAAAVDFSEYLTARLPLFIGVVLGLSFLLLMLVFRSLLVPLKAVVMNLLSIGAAYGVVTAIFQWGWFGDVIDIESAPIEPFVPMMMFAILFGLSMDYEVFLLSRIREEYVRTGDSRLSVADGLASTARVMAPAAAIMVVVFGSFIGESDRIVKLFGVGLSIAVLLDATIVRMLLVPATMELLGDANWWLPRWLDRAMPRVAVEGHPLEVPPPELEPV